MKRTWVLVQNYVSKIQYYIISAWYRCEVMPGVSQYFQVSIMEPTKLGI